MPKPTDDTIARLQQRILQFVDERNWKQFHNPKDMALSLTLEAAVGEELCDCLYWVLYMAHTFGIDIQQAFEQKMQKNEAKYPVDRARSSHKKYTQLKDKAA